MIWGELWEKTHLGSGALTDREREILALFARGDGNQSGDGMQTRSLVVWDVKNGLVQDRGPAG